MRDGVTLWRRYIGNRLPNGNSYGFLKDFEREWPDKNMVLQLDNDKTD